MLLVSSVLLVLILRSVSSFAESLRSAAPGATGIVRSAAPSAATNGIICQAGPFRRVFRSDAPDYKEKLVVFGLHEKGTMRITGRMGFDWAFGGSNHGRIKLIVGNLRFRTKMSQVVGMYPPKARTWR